ncbi:MAG: type II 3-dehydroquinate dehydratase, partial [Mycobacterium sp.]|nr:type II 3-dehydroquinate dehydratase [Mycobacterium sp.]
QIIDWIHEARERAGGIVINPAAYSHTSVAIADALRSVGLPVAEVHLSNIHAREEFRHHSYVSAVADMVVAGAGPLGYELAVRYLASRLLP